MSNAVPFDQRLRYRVLLPVAIVLVNAAPALFFAQISSSLRPCAIAGTSLFIALWLLLFSTAVVRRALCQHWFRRAFIMALVLRGATMLLCVGLLPDILLLCLATSVSGAVDTEDFPDIGSATPMQLCGITLIYSVGITLMYGAVVWILALRYERLFPARPTSFCAHCGYDLRATPQRCPECGEIPRTRIAALFK